MRTPAPLVDSLFSDDKSTVKSQSWRGWFSQFSTYYDQVLKWQDPYNPDFGKVEPPVKYRKIGLIAYADGVSWNPLGTGTAKYVYWNGSEWQ